MLNAFKRALRREGLVAAGDHVVVAVSGGADSVALLALFGALGPSWDLRLTVAHLHHGLRGTDADDDARFVRRLCRERGLACTVGRADVRARARRKGVSIEMAAREARYAFLARAARRVGAAAVATAHTADDQAETVLLKLLRGAGRGGLGGMAPRTVIDGLTVIRPLLDAKRADLERWLRRRGLAWREDATNRDTDILRNRVRHELLPLLEARFQPETRAVLCRTARLLKDEDRWLDALCGERLAALQAAAGAAGALDARALAALPPAARRRTLRLWLRGRNVDPAALDFRTVQRLDALAAGTGGSARVPLAGGGCVERVYGLLRVNAARGADKDDGRAAFRAEVRVPGETRVRAAGLRVVAALETGIARPPPGRPGTLPARASLRPPRRGERLTVRNWQAGDRMAPLGLRGTRKLQDIFVDAKVPRAARASLPVVVCGEQIVWLPGYRVARDWAVADPAQRALQLCLEPL